MSHPPFDHWQPYSIETIQRKYAGLPWILAGGYAIEYVLGESFRSHGDIDILIPRSAQRLLPQVEATEQLFVNDSPGHLSPWELGEYAEQPIYSFWIAGPTLAFWCLQVMLYDESDGDWHYKRNADIRMPAEEIYLTQHGIRILKPEIQLLYKSKTIRPKDQLDFAKCLPTLSPPARTWLAEALERCYDTHLWLDLL